MANRNAKLLRMEAYSQYHRRLLRRGQPLRNILRSRQSLKRSHNHQYPIEGERGEGSDEIGIIMYQVISLVESLQQKPR